MLVIVFDQDAVVSWQDRQVGHSAGPILVVHTANVCFGWTLNGQRQTTYENMIITYVITFVSFFMCFDSHLLLFSAVCVVLSQMYTSAFVTVFGKKFNHQKVYMQTSFVVTAQKLNSDLVVADVLCLFGMQPPESFSRATMILWCVQLL